MTTSIRVECHNYPVLIRTKDAFMAEGVLCEHVTEQVLTAGQTADIYATTTRTIEIVDIAYDDPRVPVAETEPGKT